MKIEYMNSNCIFGIFRGNDSCNMVLRMKYCVSYFSSYYENHSVLSQFRHGIYRKCLYNVVDMIFNDDNVRLENRQDLYIKWCYKDNYYIYLSL